VVGRFTQEVITPCLERTFMILYRMGQIPPPPEAIEGQELSYNFLGQLAKAQKMSEMNSVTNFLTISSNIAAVKPDALDKINTDKVIDNLAEIEGIDPEMLNSDEQVEAIRKQREQIQAQQMQLAMMQQGGQVAKDVTQAEKNLKDDNSKK
jgi:hypothetical protein